MTPERHQQIGQIFHAALELEPGQRAAFLAQACAGDEALRREVESLIASREQAEASVSALIGQRIGHYQILSLLGAGGMGEVYLAEDQSLRRKVALKLLPGRFTQEADRVRRFEQEARAASALNHPNILTIHEIGQVDGRHYLVTEFIDGQTLRQRMKSARLEIREALDVAVQVASALAAAHEAGIVHRDVKPENVMLRRDGYVKVLDFGLAKLTEPRVQAIDTAALTAAEVSTEAGVVMGTVHYMSPEQARGQKVDGRSDIFSLGVVLYEMIAGRVPFEGKTSSDVIAALLAKEPLPLTQFLPEVPVEMERIMTKALQKDREERYQTIKDVLRDLKALYQELERAKELTVTSTVSAPGLRWGGWLSSRVRLAWAAVIVVVMAGLGFWLLWRSPPAGPQPEIRSLAVLPLENLSGDPAQEYFADGMTEALISNLARIRALKVISRTSVMRYKGIRKSSLPEIAQELKVDAVIEGTVQRSGGRVRVTAQLIHAATDAHLWASDYERDLTDVLKLQSEIARAVADEIRIQVTAEERARLASAHRVNPQAHEAYLLGRYHHSKGNEQGRKQAIEYFARAIELAPDYAAAYAGLSDAWLQLGIYGEKPIKEVEPPARGAALKAIGLDEQLAEGHISLGNIKHYYDWDWAGAELEFKRALELDPGGIDAHITYGLRLMHLGRHNEAIREGQIAAQLDPLSWATQSALGRFLYCARRYEEALPHLKRSVELEPRSIAANSRLGDVYAQLGRHDEAIAAYEKNRELMPESGDRQATLARVYALMGRQREARQMIRGVKANSFRTAAVYVALGDKDEAFSVLDKAIEGREPILALKEDPQLDNLHSDPRWKVLLRRMNFPPE
jgi:eukaryotic-like serine/threonine-protein kinase